MERWRAPKDHLSCTQLAMKSLILLVKGSTIRRERLTFTNCSETRGKIERERTDKTEEMLIWGKALTLDADQTEAAFTKE